MNHPGMVHMKSLARLHVWWPRLDHDMEQTVRDCGDCQANRSRSPLKVNHPWIWPTRPWQRIHLDFAGPFNGEMFLLVVDAQSKWIEVFPMSSTTASATIRALRFLFATHGLPEVIVSDNGPQFVAQKMKDFLKSNGIRQCLSSPYHPASYGEAERVLRTFKESMKTMKDEPGTQAEKLARFLLSYRTTPHTGTGCTPMGRRIRTRLEILRPNLSARIAKKSKLVDQSTRRLLEIGEPVMVKDYRDRKRPWIQGVIQDRLGPVTYRVLVGDLLWKRHIDQLRSSAGSKVADETPVRCPNVTLGDEPAELNDFSLVLPQPRQNFPPSQTSASETVPVPPTENPETSAPPAVIPDLSREPSAEVSTPNDTSREPSADVPTPKRYPTRVRNKTK